MKDEIEKVYFTSSDIARDVIPTITHYELHKFATELGVSYKKNTRGSNLYPLRSVERLKKHIEATRAARVKTQVLKNKLKEYGSYKKNITNKFKKEKVALTDQKRAIQEQINQLNKEFNELVGDVDRDIRLVNMRLKTDFPGVQSKPGFLKT